ncbi:MAG: glycosyltransferase family 2 protein [Scytonematopsis contorta HA4267-MV1]|jgi:glycosyltransferase involved in cell wall biosynthesis|nr:glycosyltransferase family 2 protein [Scytonematopsis contorta HA4267-MV1]
MDYEPEEKIGIILATYNPNLEYFQKQIESIKNQSWQNWVCHIVDDCSQTEYQDSIKKIVADDLRFICHFHSENINHYQNFERGLRYCAQYAEITAISFCDQDDIWQQDKLKVSLEKLRSENALLVHSDLELINNHDQIIHPSAWNFEGRNPQQASSDLLLLRNVVTGCSLLFCTSLLDDILPFPEQDEIKWYHDWWVAIVASQRGKIVHINQPLIRYRIHDSNSVGVMSDAGKFHKELSVWISKKFRITGKSYLIHRNLSQAFYNRFKQQLTLNYFNPFDDKRLDFGLGILQLAYKSFKVGYNSEGIALRIWVLKVLFDLKKITSIIIKTVLSYSAKQSSIK